MALNGMVMTSGLLRRRRPGTSGFRFLGFAAVTLERSRRGELAQAMTDHVFRNEYLHVDLAVVNHEREADELRHDRAGPGPRLDRLFRAHLLRSLDLLENLEIDKRAFFAGAAHILLFSLAGTKLVPVRLVRLRSLLAALRDQVWPRLLGRY